MEEDTILEYMFNLDEEDMLAQLYEEVIRYDDDGGKSMNDGGKGLSNGGECQNDGGECLNVNYIDCSLLIMHYVVGCHTNTYLR